VQLLCCERLHLTTYDEALCEKRRRSGRCEKSYCAGGLRPVSGPTLSVAPTPSPSKKIRRGWLPWRYDCRNRAKREAAKKKEQS
jgi:hypothetical protein